MLRGSTGVTDRTKRFFTGFIRDKSFRAVRFTAEETLFGNVLTLPLQRKQRRDLCSVIASKCVVPPRYAIVSPLPPLLKTPATDVVNRSGIVVY